MAGREWSERGEAGFVCIAGSHLAAEVSAAAVKAADGDEAAVHVIGAAGVVVPSARGRKKVAGSSASGATAAYFGTQSASSKPRANRQTLKFLH